MKKLFALLTVLGMVFFASCVPAQQEEAEEVVEPVVEEVVEPVVEEVPVEGEVEGEEGAQ